MKKSTALQITASKIEVSANSHSKTGYYASHRVWGILPGCRKSQLLTITAMTGYIWVKALYSYNGSAHIKPEDWAALLNASPVKSDTLQSFKYDVTPEVEAAARAEVLSITTCPAVTDTSRLHPDYKLTFNPIEDIRATYYPSMNADRKASLNSQIMHA